MVKGRKLSKLAAASPAIVLSEAAVVARQRKAPAAIARIVLARQNASGTPQQKQERQHKLTLALRALCAPLYKVRMAEGFEAFVSANVLHDYRCGGIEVEVLAMPVFQRFGRVASIRQADIDAEYLERFHASRANDHAMGKAQSAWRIAHAEGDDDAERVVYYWLFHGSLKPCNAPDCTCCGKRKRLQPMELQVLATRYLELEHETRSRNFGDRRPHKLSPPTAQQLRMAFNGNWRDCQPVHN